MYSDPSHIFSVGSRPSENMRVSGVIFCLRQYGVCSTAVQYLSPLPCTTVDIFCIMVHWLSAEDYVGGRPRK